MKRKKTSHNDLSIIRKPGAPSPSSPPFTNTQFSRTVVYGILIKTFAAADVLIL